MLGGWLVESVIRFNTTGISQLERAGIIVNNVALREAELTGQLTAQEAAWLRNAAAAERAAAARQEAYNHFTMGVAAVGAATIGYSIDQAANFERAMLNLQIATASSREQMEAFRKSIYDTAYATAQSAPIIASIYGDIASTSGLPAASLTPEFLSKVTKFGEIVQMKSKGTTHEYSAAEAAKQLIELAHQYRAYTPEGISTFAEMLHKATYFMPGGLAQFLTQSKFFTPLMALSGNNYDAMQQSILLGILMQQTGLGRGRGGTGIAAFERQIIQGLSVTAHMDSGRRAALIAAGLINPKTGDTPFVRHNAQGSYFDVIGALTQVQRYMDTHTAGLTGAARDRAEQDILRNVLSALGVQGSLVALVAAGGGLGQMRNVQARMRNIPSIDQDQAARLKTFWGEWQHTTSLVQTSFTTLGLSILPEAEHALHNVNVELLAFNKYLEAHPNAAKGIMTFIAYLTGAAALRTIGAVTSKFLTFIGVLGAEGAAAEGATVVGATAAAATGVSKFTAAIRLLNPELILITTTLGFLYGLKHEADYVKTHPGSQMYGNNYAGPGDPSTWDVDMYGNVIQHGYRLPYRSPRQQLNDRLKPAIHVHNPVIHVHTPDPATSGLAIRAVLGDPRSPLYSSTRTHARIPFATSVPPR